MTRALFMLMFTLSLTACDYQMAAPVDEVTQGDLK